MDLIICSPSVAHTDILQDNISETLCEWCRLGDSNTRPTDYKSVALPTELNRQNKQKNILTFNIIQHIYFY